MNPKKLAYKEMKKRQLEDLRNNVCNYHVYKEFSTPFTYAFVKLGISPNAITLSSILLVLAGFYFLSLGTYFGFIIGLLFFALFKIFDMSDGEVVRIQNSHSIEGAYYDRISHYVFGISLAMGLGMGLYRLYGQELYILLGSAFSLVIILENAMRDSLRLFLRVGLAKIGKGKDITKNLKQIDRDIRKKFLGNMHQGKEWAEGNFVAKSIGIYPEQGLIYSESMMIPILGALTIVEYVLASYFYIEAVFSGFHIGLIAPYIALVSAVKAVYIIIFIYGLEKKRPLTSTIKSL